MKLNQDITRYGWIAVGIILAISGAQNMMDMKIYGRVRLAGAEPLLEGWPVFVVGLLELAAGIIALVWVYKKTR